MPPTNDNALSMIHAPLVAAIILNWNEADLTIKCLEGLFQQDPIPVVIICDNASTDGSPEKIRSWAINQHLQVKNFSETPPLPPELDSDVYILNNGANLGYSAGNNPGLRFALGLGTDYIWIMNNDSNPLPGALSAFLKCAEKNQTTGLFGATVLRAADPDYIEAAGGCRYHPITTISRSAHAGRHVDGSSDLPEPKLNYIYGASIFARSKVFKDVGLFNENFFLFYEELDLCLRAKKAGYGLKWCREARVTHKGAQSVCSHEKGFIQYHENLSTVIFTRIHRPRCLLFALVFRFLSKAFILPLRGCPGQINMVWRAYLDGLRWKLK